MDNTLRIIVFFARDGKNWKPLEGISKYLNEKQFVPSIGDRVTSLDEDWKAMDLESGADFKCVVTVKNRIVHYGAYDVAILCDYEKW